MKKAFWVAGVVGLCALSFAAGSKLDRSGDEVPAPIVEITPDPDWRAAIHAAREASDGATARGHALALLDDASGDTALIHAVQLLAPVATDADVPVLESLARTGDGRIARHAVEALGLIGSDAAVAILDDLAKQTQTRGMALQALGASGHPIALSRLKAALGDPTVEHDAAAGLVALGSADAAALMIERFEDSLDWQASTWAEHLASMPAEREEARQALLRASKGGPDIRREAAMSALARHRDPAIYGLLAGKAALGDAVAIRALGQLDDARAVDVLGGLLARGGTTAMPALDALGVMRHPRARDLVLKAIQSGPEAQAVQAIYLVQDLSDPHVLATFLWAATEGRMSVAQSASNRLMQHPWGRTIPQEVLDLARERLETGAADPGSCVTVLLRYGDRDDHRLVFDAVLDGPQQVRLASVWTLQSLQLDVATELLLRLMNDPDPYVSNQALAAAMGRGGLETRVESILLAQLDEDPGNIGNVAHYLVQLNTPAALLRLEELAENGEPSEQSIAISALMSSQDRSIATRLVVEAKDMPPELQSQIYSAALYNAAIDPTELADRVLAYGDPSIRYVAVEALANAGTPRAAKRLLDMSYDPETSESALNALARVGGAAAEERLLDAASDPKTASAALSGLTQLGTPAARDAIANVARSGPAEARLPALYALQSNPGSRAETTFVDAAFDADPSIRRAAIDGLAAVGTRGAADTLAELLDGEDAEAAAYALQRMGGRAYRENKERIDAIFGASGVDSGFIENPWQLPVDIHEEIDIEW
ncbi:MAG: HEAT repeat domain-containing protein [Alphaproteobacteria bacterium]|nr:HEAT repeat domain-containing protein [Alphaproteobacteria bacterium]